MLCTWLESAFAAGFEALAEGCAARLACGPSYQNRRLLHSLILASAARGAAIPATVWAFGSRRNYLTGN